MPPLPALIRPPLTPTVKRDLEAGLRHGLAVQPMVQSFAVQLYDIERRSGVEARRVLIAAAQKLHFIFQAYSIAQRCLYPAFFRDFKAAITCVAGVDADTLAMRHAAARLRLDLANPAIFPRLGAVLRGDAEQLVRWWGYLEFAGRHEGHADEQIRKSNRAIPKDFDL